MDLYDYSFACYGISFNHGFYEDCTNLFEGDTMHPIWVLSRLALIDSEVAEAMEAIRKDDEANFTEELADVFIRLMDLVGSTGLGWDFEEVVQAKMEKNRNRPYKHGKNS